MHRMFLVLMLANLVYFGWHHVHRQAQVVSSPGLLVPRGVATLVLLREAAPDPGAGRGGDEWEASGPSRPLRSMGSERVEGEGSPGPEADSPAVGARCLTLGPFEDRSLMKKTARRMGEAGLSPRVRRADKQSPTAYWVYLPPRKDRGAAERVVERLVASGVDDYYIVKKGAQANAVSLGLFSREAGAQHRLDEVRALGLSPRLQVRYRPVTVYWLDYQVSAAQQMDPRPWRPGDGVSSPIEEFERLCGEIASPQGIE